MSEFKGRTVNVGSAIQQNYNVPVTTPEYTIPWLEADLKDVQESIQNESAFGNITHYNDSVTTGVHGEGSIKTKLWHEGLFYQLVWLFGKFPMKETLEDGSYKYTFEMANNNHHFAQTIMINDPNSDVYFPTALINDATIEWTPSDFASFTASLISKRSVATTAFTAAYAEDAEFRPDQLELKIADSVSALESAEVATKFTSVSLSVNKNVEGVQTSDSGQDYGAFSNGDLEATISFEKLYVDTAYRDIALADTAKAVSFGFVDPLNKAGTTEPTSLRFIFPKVKLSSYAPSYSLSDTATESFEGIALFDVTEGSLMTAELVTKYDHDVTPR